MRRLTLTFVRTAAAVLTGAMIVLTGLLPASVSAQDRVGFVEGRVLDAETGVPVDHAQILLEEANRSTHGDIEGRFILRNIPAGIYTLKAFRIGYRSLVRSLEVVAGDTVSVSLQMIPTVLDVGEVIVEDDAADAGLAEPEIEMEGARLRQKMGTTIAETLDEEPGISMRSMGPAPARPVLRGLGGERLLVLEDGGRTGDLSATSTDHALVIDPMTAERLEIVRGPAALVYGPNALGGVINVVRDYVPSSRPDALHAHLSGQGQSVNSGYAAAAAVSAPVGGSIVVRADGSFREAGEVNTPEGTLGNTDLHSVNTSVGGSLVRRWGFAGLAGSFYTSTYGIPGGFVGAHPDGVSIEIERRHLEGKSDVFTGSGFIPRLELRGSWSRYFHQEFESNGSLGIEFGLLSWHGSVVARTARRGPLRKGAFGVWIEYRDYASGGFTFTPPSTERTVAGFAYQDAHVGDFSLQAGLRYDVRQVLPSREFVSDRLGRIEERSFGGVSASVSAQWHATEAFSVGATGMRSLRMPGIEELFSEGPHLAAYSFEIGNPRLDQETGYGTEVFARYRGQRLTARAAGYVNVIDNYIFPLDTGELNTRIYLPIFQYTGAEARMVGTESQATVQLHPRWSINGSASVVHGTLTDVDQPIPWIPPLKGTVGARHERGRFTVGADVRLSRGQDRVGPFETPTGGYAVLDLFAQYHVTGRGFLHTIDLGIENATDTAYRDHLSRVKSIMPEPGRNVKLLYKIYF